MNDLKELNFVNKIFENEQIPLWLNWGTLLGLYRDGKFVDDDIDLSTVQLNKPILKEKYNSIVNALKENGFTIEYQTLGFVAEKGNFRAGFGFYDIDRETSCLYQKPLSVDYNYKFFAKKWFFLFMKNNPTNLKYFFFKLFGGSIIVTVVPAEMICPLRRLRVNGYHFWIPNKTEEYLEYLYGKNWTIPDPTFPHIFSKKNLGYFKGTFGKFYARCPRCKKSFLADRPDFNETIEKINMNCIECGHKWKQKVAIRGTVLKWI